MVQTDLCCAWLSHLTEDLYCPIVAIPDDLPYEGLLSDQLQQIRVHYKESGLGVLRRQYFNLTGSGVLAYRAVASSLRFARFSKQRGIDLIHSNSTAVVTGGGAAWLTGIPHIWHVREIFTDPAWFNKAIANMLNLAADQIVAVSGPAKASLLFAQPGLADKTTVIHNGIDPTPYLSIDSDSTRSIRGSWAISDNEIVIGMVGRISAWKGQEFLLRAAAPLLKEYPHVRVVFVGGTVPGQTVYRDNLRQQIEQLNLQGQVIIEDFRSDIPLVLSAFDVFVLPSIRPDPFPTVVLEAMAAGKPVVATNHGGAIEQIDNGTTGMLVSPTDPREMTHALKMLTTDSALRKQWGDTGRDRIRGHFTVDRYVADINNLYCRLLQK